MISGDVWLLLIENNSNTPVTRSRAVTNFYNGLAWWRYRSPILREVYFYLLYAVVSHANCSVDRGQVA